MFQMNAQHTLSHNVKPDANLLVHYWENSMEIPHVPVNVSVQTLPNLTVKCNATKKEKL